MATNYFTNWVEAIPTKRATNKVVMEFLEETIITRFIVPSNNIVENAKDFSYLKFSSFFFNYGIVLSHSSNYYS